MARKNKVKGKGKGKNKSKPPPSPPRQRQKAIPAYTLCRFYAAGFCGQGDFCEFQHPVQTAVSPPYRHLTVEHPCNGVAPLAGVPIPVNRHQPFNAGDDLRGRASRSDLAPPPAACASDYAFSPLKDPTRERLTEELERVVNAIRRAAGAAPLSPAHGMFAHWEAMFRAVGPDGRLPLDPEIDCDDGGYESGANSDDYDLFSNNPNTKARYRKYQGPIVPRYEEPVFAAGETLRFVQAQNRAPMDWARLDRLEPGRVVNLEFAPDFVIDDDHIAELTDRPNHLAQLRRLRVGDAGTGTGGGIEDEDLFAELLALCPALRVLHLEACTALTDRTLLAIAEHCPQIERVHLSGHDRVPGGVTGAALHTLAKKRGRAPRLRELALIDQPAALTTKTCRCSAPVKALSRARPALWVLEGKTLGGGYSANVAAARDGGESVQSWLHGKIVEIDMDCGGFGGGQLRADDGFTGGLCDYDRLDDGRWEASWPGMYDSD